ncbi:MAG: sigma-54-dependent Fis family transcriptional regulator [Candidatus Krumholzibacteriota bacterium]|nr:sigma-54-dependent Fis family transcriptional regulator [Candidatus Krumholzibacteriota bacterium]
MSKQVLIVDDEESIRNSLEKLLSFEKYGTFSAPDGRSALELLLKERIDIVLLDIKMPGMDGLEVLGKIKERQPGLPVVIISGHGNISTAVEATKLGAFDFIEKPIDLERLLLTIRNGIRQGDLSRQNLMLKKEVIGRTEIIGEHKAILDILATIERVAPTNARVLITGENGTGKEMAARKLYEQSNRSDQPFIEVNCAAIPEELIESELFGHEKGSFTGAVSQRVGKFELADGGTLFLDEVGDMSLSAQAKVLRVLQEGVFQRVGGSETKKVDVRVIAASNRNLIEEAEKGNFREDLFYRLNVVPVKIPPLRERKTDIRILSEYFISLICQDLGVTPKKFSPDVYEVFFAYAWPGNIRELKNLIERLCILVPSDTIAAADLPLFELAHETGRSNDPFEARTYQDFKDISEKEYLIRKLRDNNGNVSRTARELGMQRSNLYKKIEKYQLDARHEDRSGEE